MKKIQPLAIWKDGETKNAEILFCQVTSDDLKSSAIFYYRLLSIDLSEIATGNLVMDGQDYEGYSTNEYAINWVATKLGITIIEDVV